MKFNDNKYGLVTGAAGLLGIEHCKSILDANNGLIINDIDKKKLIKDFKSLKKNYPKSNILK